MSKIKVYYSFDFENDFDEASKILGIKTVESIPIISKLAWDRITQGGIGSIKRWITDQMAFAHCIIVLIGNDTLNRPLINYEIKKAWRDNKALMGIYLNNLSGIGEEMRTEGKNPFCHFSISDIDLCKIIKCYNPDPDNPIEDIKINLEKWVKESINIRMKYMFQNEYHE